MAPTQDVHGGGLDAQLEEGDTDKDMGGWAWGREQALEKKAALERDAEPCRDSDPHL